MHPQIPRRGDSGTQLSTQIEPEAYQVLQQSRGDLKTPTPGLTWETQHTLSHTHTLSSHVDE